MKKIFENKPRFIFWAGFLAVLMLTVVGIFYSDKMTKDRNLLATVGEEKIMVEDLNRAIYGIEFAGTPEIPTTPVNEEERKRMIEELITRSLVRQELKRLGIEVTEDEVSLYIEQNVPDFDSYTPEQKNLTRAGVKDMISIEKIKDSQIAWREGRVLIARFDRAYQEIPANMEELFASDRKYARQLIEGLHTRVKAGEISFEKAMDLANNDPVIGKPAWDEITYTFSTEFSREDSKSRGILSISADFWDKIFQIKERGISEIQTAKLEAIDGSSVEQIESLYFVAEVTDLQEGFKNYEDLIKALSERFKVVRHY